jgi:hypothetical protein
MPSQFYSESLELSESFSASKWVDDCLFKTGAAATTAADGLAASWRLDEAAPIGPCILLMGRKAGGRLTKRPLRRGLVASSICFRDSSRSLFSSASVAAL